MMVLLLLFALLFPQSSVQIIGFNVTAVYKGAKPVTGSVLVLQTNCVVGQGQQTLESSGVQPLVNNTAKFSMGIDFSKNPICIAGYINDPKGNNILSNGAGPSMIPNSQPFNLLGNFTVTGIRAYIIIELGCATCNPPTPNTLYKGSEVTPTLQYNGP